MIAQRQTNDYGLYNIWNKDKQQWVETSLLKEIFAHFEEKEEATADLGRKVSAGELFNVDEQAPGISYEVPQEAPQAR